MHGEMAYVQPSAYHSGACCPSEGSGRTLTHSWQRWNGQYYENVQPKDLGLDIQLGHMPGEICERRALHTEENFTLIHTNGVRVVRMHFCKCKLSGHIPPYVQLLRRRFWPATCKQPESATTFEALDLFHRLALYGKLNGYDFVRALEAATDGSFVRRVAVSAQRQPLHR